ncbi:MAG: phosphatidylglycerophosphatase A [Pseudomonadota bacterium]
MAIFIASGGFVGYFPIAPGTAGSLAALILIWYLRSFSWIVLLFTAVALLVMGIWAAGETCQILKKKDASQVVMDEIVGMMITVIGLPLTPYWLLVGFFVFRILDIVKPSPAKYFDEKVAGGLGVMMDDVVAGIYGNIILQLMMRAQI